MPAIERPDPAYRHVVALTIALFLSYLTVAMSLSAVTVHVVQNLGLGNTYGGLAVGIAFLSTILTRGWAGALADRIGGKLCMQRGPSDLCRRRPDLPSCGLARPARHIAL